MSIKILDTHTINKIAAGEVVERPASVVKELVENSIDAGASSITVEIKNGGIDFIRITDNGKGIPKDEVEIAFLRHATSKITQADDLLEVVSLGFRGEALASIASVSKVELITKQQGELTGKRIELEAGKLINSDEIACPDGTTFIMRYLFFNIPARKAFLKSAGTEAAKIADYMYKLAMAHPEISFKYIQNNKLIFNTPGGNNLKSAVLSLYGKEIAKNTMPVNYEEKGIRVVGLLGNPSISRGNRGFEHFFINGRYIRSILLQRAVEDAYKTLMMVGKFPFVVLHLHLAPNLVDVNVHPTKLEVRFKNSDLIREVVYKGIRAELNAQNEVREIKKAPKPIRHEPLSRTETQQAIMETFFTPRKKDNTLDYTKLVDQPTSKGDNESHLASPRQKIFKPSNPQESEVLQEKTINISSEPVNDKTEISSTPLNEPLVIKEESSCISIEKASESSEKTSETAPSSKESPPEVHGPKEGTDYFIIGQLFNTYWLIEYEKKVLVIDQHAAHERVMYEQYIQGFSKGKVSTQLLLVPETFTATAQQSAYINQNLEKLTNLGFKLEKFGENTFIIREVPYLFNKPLRIEEFQIMIDHLELNDDKDIYEFKEEAIIMQACKSAIKAHDKLSKLECQKLIESLLTLENPYTCPHGRPTIVSLREEDIQKIFKRL